MPKTFLVTGQHMCILKWTGNLTSPSGILLDRAFGQVAKSPKDSAVPSTCR